MKLTDRGKNLTLFPLLTLTGAALLFAAWLGQEWKQDRLGVSQGNTIPPLSCYEDEPCWDCTTMGNGVCGP